MLNNQNIKQKSIPSCIYLPYILSLLTPMTTAVAAATPSSFCSLWDNIRSTQNTCFFFSFSTLNFHFYILFLYLFFFLIDKSNQYLNDILNFIYTTMLIRNIFVLYFIIIITINVIFNISYIKK
jgi:hypothetical protein